MINKKTEFNPRLRQIYEYIGLLSSCDQEYKIRKRTTQHPQK